MNKTCFALVAIAALALGGTAASAQNQTCGLGAACAQDNSTNVTNQGGSGGEGGSAQASASAGAISGSASGVSHSGNSSNRLSQQQLQQLFNRQTNEQSQGQIGINKNRNVAKSNSGGNSISNHIEGDEAAASTAVAGQGVSGSCMGSSGVGVQTLPVGVSVGSNWFDEQCREERRAREIAETSKIAALALLCEDEKTRKAFMVAYEVSKDPKDACPQDQIALRKEDLKKATYWQHPTSGEIFRVENTQIILPGGHAEQVAWTTPRFNAGTTVASTK